MDILSLQFKHLNNACQNNDVNLVSLSLMILLGVPNLQMMWSKNKRAVACASMVVGTANSVTYFENRSTIVSIASLPDADVGRPVTKSRLTTSNG